MRWCVYKSAGPVSASVGLFCDKALALAISSGLTALILWPAIAQESQGGPDLAADECTGVQACSVEFEPDFFARYNPITALDMVRNVPGFSIDNGDQSRGFAGAAGNVLINGKRPSTKSDSVSAILSRIPAGSVARIDLIRGQTGGLDLRGQAVAVNLILNQGSALSLAWEAGLFSNPDNIGAYPFGSLSVTDSSGALTFTAGLEAERNVFREGGRERVFDAADRLIEERDERFFESGRSGGLSLNGEYKPGNTAYRLNASIEAFTEDGGENSFRTPLGEDTILLRQGDLDRGWAFEIGPEIERPLGASLTAKLIGLYRYDRSTNTGDLARGRDQTGLVFETQTETRQLSTETIVRVEVDYAGIAGHLIELSGEGAINRLESRFSLDQAPAPGLPLETVPVPGAMTEVQERRADFALSDSFSLGAVSVDAVIAAEISNIKQTGGFAADRSFSFLKPSLTLTANPWKRGQIRARGFREIGQLDFGDFVSSTDLGDAELALGNPDLSPEATWTGDLTIEQRFGDIGAFSITGYTDFIADVNDLLPVGNGLEVPGNIGSGRRSGVRSEMTLPLDVVDLGNARLDVSGSWQRSRVSDPVTGLDRRLSGERRWQSRIAFRQDLVKTRWAWGGDVNFFGDQQNFGLDEFDVFSRSPDLDLFIETTRIRGLKINFSFENVLDTARRRDRMVFTTARFLSPLAFREFRDRTPREMILTFSGTF